MILVIDNYDSFVYNIVQYLGAWEKNVRVFRNDAISLGDISELKPDAVLISPGPGNPKEAGISLDLIKTFAGKFPILGVCLGHQCIGEAFGGRIVRAKNLMHGKTSAIHHDGKGIFKGVANPFDATRYHSLIIDRPSVPRELAVTAKTKDGEIMGVRHKKHDIEGVQFHPESILTGPGMQLISNFVKNVRGKRC